MLWTMISAFEDGETTAILLPPLEIRCIFLEVEIPASFSLVAIREPRFNTHPTENLVYSRPQVLSPVLPKKMGEEGMNDKSFL